MLLLIFIHSLLNPSISIGPPPPGRRRVLLNVTPDELDRALQTPSLLQEVALRTSVAALDSPLLSAHQ
ncbi:hypothetical protein [Thauera sp.]|uniref:hypothetical protein n=1 Tax=Thauera sp. TaxID=1905334 RepID=UPI002CF7F6FB|nr:hypothetical protein [Thauera sp.]HRP26011.1 hypothetical protein [Thauera sp.]